jgi:hypothetical protein
MYPYTKYTVTMNNNCSPKRLLAEICPSMVDLLEYYADRGLNYIISAAGGTPCVVSQKIRNASANTLIRILESNAQTDADIEKKINYTFKELSQTERRAVKGIVSKVLLHMRFESHKTI